MFTILVISDNHGDKAVMEKVLEKESYDYSVHLGDSQMSEAEIKSMFNFYVGGNNDQDFSVEEEVIEFDHLRIAICHGHTVFDRSGGRQLALAQFAQKYRASVVFFGHTHIPAWENYQGLTLINPGSITFPRSFEGKTYCLVEIDDYKIANVIFKNP
ncbi:YfcE family phosphodiesterase [Mycoplasma sp. ATU-Cv-703]|uniref:YfcE family phosphodiesterase n=1 Tax=Mycoplasma sp. ATU-Cv-703 TaxID=2498595 RepID=UPI000FDE5E17